MILYPHEMIIRDIKKYLVNTKLWKISFTAISFIMLIIATTCTTIILIDLPRYPELLNGILAGMVMIGITGLTCELMIKEYW